MAITFATVSSIALSLPDVEASTKYDGSPVLRARDSFMAGLAMHPSAEADTLVVRMDAEQRALLLEDAPDTYYVTDYYRPHPVVLVRMNKIDREALRDLLAVAWRVTTEKSYRSSF